MIPHIVLAWGDIEVPRDDERGPGVPAAHLGGEAFEEVELVVELGIEDPVGGVAAGGDIEVLDLDPRDRGRDAAGVALPADGEVRGVLEGQTGSDRHAVPALLAADPQVWKTSIGEGPDRKLGLSALDLLQAENVGGMPLDEASHMVGAQADRVDVPGSDPQAHGGESSARFGDVEPPPSSRRDKAPIHFSQGGR